MSQRMKELTECGKMDEKRHQAEKGIRKDKERGRGKEDVECGVMETRNTMLKYLLL